MTNLTEDFWNNIDVKDKDDCWPWKGTVSSNGYAYTGNIKYNTHSVARLAWILINGEVPKGQLICHKCDNKICCNPNHLYCGTYSDNMSDRFKNYPSAYEFRCHAKFYEGEIWLIRRLKGKFSSTLVSKMFKCSDVTILNIWKSGAWMAKEGVMA
ncbi:MAG: HNH endonuclease [Gammaproteobacteria bacterium]|nr:HNH endonuclease [Gammaproteobacteria bacterium]